MAGRSASSRLPDNIANHIRARLVVLQVLEASRPQLNLSAATATTTLQSVLDDLTAPLLDPDLATASWPAFAARLRDRYAEQARTRQLRGTAATVSGEIEKALEAAIARPNDDPLQELFDEVVAAAVAEFGRYGVQTHPGVEIGLDVVHSQMSPAEAGCPYLVAAVTMADPAQPLHRRVGLSIGVGQPGKIPILDWKSVLTVPYLLFHEVLSHGLRTPWTQEPEEDVASPFQEGWMDYVALLLHDAYSARQGIKSSIVRNQPGDCRYHAQRYSRSRLARGDELEVHAQRDIGWAAANRFHLATRSRGATPDATLMHLSLLINTSKVSTAGRDLLIGRINEQLPVVSGSSAGGGRSRFAQLMTAVDASLKSADLSGILGILAARVS